VAGDLAQRINLNTRKLPRIVDRLKLPLERRGDLAEIEVAMDELGS
jgi:hypothetical protein